MQIWWNILKVALLQITLSILTLSLHISTSSDANFLCESNGVTIIVIE